MEIGIKDRVENWARSGGDFNAGLALFGSYNRNVFYVRNIGAKGTEKGLTTLVCEFSNKTKIPANEIWAMISRPALPSKPGADQSGNESLDCAIINGGYTKHGQHKKTVRLREEFPFLGSKDCPEELALLVNKMLTAYDNYRSGHEKLFDADPNNLELCYQTAREVLDAHILNREIWEELNHYKLHGTVLGNRPEFRARVLREKYRAIGTVNLVKIIGNNIPRKMSYYKKQLASSGTKNKLEIRKKMASQEEELSVIRGILIERGEI
jgi:hypothetical protein